MNKEKIIEELEIKFPRVEQRISIDMRNRIVLVSWMYEIKMDLGYSHYTYIKSIEVFDRYFSRCDVSKNEYQLVGIASIMIAAKLNEPKIYSVETYSQLTDNYYNAESIMDMERFILISLEHNVGLDSPMDYICQSDLELCSNTKNNSFKQKLVESIISGIIGVYGAHNNYLSVYKISLEISSKYLKGSEILDSNLSFYIKYIQNS